MSKLLVCTVYLVGVTATVFVTTAMQAFGMEQFSGNLAQVSWYCNVIWKFTDESYVPKLKAYCSTTLERVDQ